MYPKRHVIRYETRPPDTSVGVKRALQTLSDDNHKHGYSAHIFQYQLVCRPLQIAFRFLILSPVCANRDLGTEGAEEADLAIRKCIGQRIIPGPRYFCATRAIGATGGYVMGYLCPGSLGVD